MTDYCTTCQKPIPASMQSRQCPSCLLINNLTEIYSETNLTGFQHFYPPTIEEMAILCPEFTDWSLPEYGGMGAVFQATHRELQRRVAIKIIHPLSSMPNAEKAIQHFRNEAKILAKMNHPDIVTIYDFKQNDSFYYLVMEIAKGENIQSLLKKNKKLTISQTLSILKPICEALEYAHQNGIIHRDIKPTNIFVHDFSKIEIIDFGIANFIEMTNDNVCGTPNYMPPEQHDPQAIVTSAADQYSLALLTFEMLTGISPQNGELPQRPPHFPRLSYNVLKRATHKIPQKRYSNILEFYQALYRITRFVRFNHIITKNFILIITLISLYFLFHFTTSFSGENTMFESIDQFLKNIGNFYLFLAIASTCFFVLQLTLGFIANTEGVESESTADATTPEATDVDSTLMASLQFFSIRSLGTFAMFFGWGGFIWKDRGLVGFALALVLGLFMSFIVCYIMSLIYKLKKEIDETTESFIGKKGKVYLTIPAQMKHGGKITIFTGTTTREFNAISEEEIPTGSDIEITSISSNDCVVVKKI